MVRVLDERRFDPPRRVEVLHAGAWWVGYQRAWRLCDDGRGWMADVTYYATEEWGRGQFDTVVTADRVREARS